MSSAAMKWAKRQQIDDDPLAGAVDVLAQMVDENGQMFHSQETISKRMRCRPRTVWSRLHEAEELGIITRARRSRGRGRGRSSDLIYLDIGRDFIVSREQVKALRQGHEIATCNLVEGGGYNSQNSHMQLAKVAKHDQLSDQPKKESHQEELASIGCEREPEPKPEGLREAEPAVRPSTTIEAMIDEVAT